MSVDTDQRDIRFAAMSLLAMREHSVSELREKLSRKFPLHPAINSVLDALAEQNLVSDKRFAESFINLGGARPYPSCADHKSNGQTV